jgi:HAD superfamily hydrolase (TIGR01509 family)
MLWIQSKKLYRRGTWNDSMKAVIFDLGHTLIDYYHEWRTPELKAITLLHAHLTSYGVEAEEGPFVRDVTSMLDVGRKKKTEDMVEIPLRDVLQRVYERYGCDGDEDLMVDGFEIFYGVLVEHRKPFPGTVEMLEGLKDRGYSIGLVSDVAWGLPSVYPQRDMQHYGLDAFFDDMVFSTDVGLRKPHPRMFKLAAYNLGVDTGESLFVGNSLQADIKGALNVGMRAILKDSCYYEHDDDIVPTGKISSWDELESFLS